MVKGVYRYIDVNLDRLINDEYKKLKHQELKKKKKKVTYKDATKSLCKRLK